MDKFVILTDNTCDMPRSYYEENQIEIMTLSYLMEGKSYNYYNSLSDEEFYEKLRNGSLPTTSQVNPNEARDVFEKYCKQGIHVLHIAFTSGLSGTYNSARIAAEELNEEYPDTKIVVVDSLCASMGEGMLLYYAVEMKKEGKSMEEIATWLEENRLHVCHNFTVDDLNHLYRGGRVSKTTAILGTMIGVKPVLHVSDEGKLVNIDKVRGRKKSLIALVDRMEKQMANYEGKNEVVMISHGDCLQDAQFVAELVKMRFGIENVMINYVGPSIGAHSGPGTVALFFMGEYR